MAHRSGIRPRGPSAPPTPKTGRDIMHPRRDAETIHVHELRLVLDPIIQALRANIQELDGRHTALRALLDLEYKARIEQAERIAQDHLDYIASTWEARAVARWVRFRFAVLRVFRRAAA